MDNRRIRLSIYIIVGLMMCLGMFASGAAAEKDISFSFENVEDYDTDYYWSNFDIQISADTRIKENALGGEGEPYFEVYIDGETIRTTTEVTRKDGTFSITIPRKKIQQEVDSQGNYEFTVKLRDHNPIGSDNTRGARSISLELDSTSKQRLALESIYGFDGAYNHFSDKRLNEEFHENRQYENFKYAFETVVPVSKKDVQKSVIIEAAGDTAGLADNLLKLPEVTGYTVKSLNHGKRADLLRTATQNDGGDYAEFKIDIDELEENTDALRNTEDKSRRKQLLRERLAILENSYKTTNEVHANTDVAVGKDDLNVGGWVEIVVGLFEANEKTYETLNAEFIQLETQLAADYIYTQEALGQSGIRKLGSEVSYVQPDYPDPSVNINAPDSVAVGESTSVSLTVSNNGGSAEAQTAAISIPQITDESQVRITDSGFTNPTYADVFGSGDQLGYKYGITDESTTAEYVLVEAAGETDPGDTVTMEIEITPQNSGELDIYAKSVARNGGWFSAPAKTADVTKDQQEENVKTRTISVTKRNSQPNANDMSFDTTTRQSVSAEFSTSDPDGDSLSHWVKSRPTHGEVSIDGDSFSYTPGGSYTGIDTFRYAVRDSDGKTATAEVDINIQQGEDRTDPQADAGSDISTTAGDKITLDGTGSTDNRGISSYRWDVDDDGRFELSGSRNTYTFSKPGTQTVTLRVTDSNGNTDSVSIEVTVETNSKDPRQGEDNKSPTARAGSDKTANVGEQIELDGSQSSDNRKITTYRWDIDADGAYELTGETAFQTFSDIGDYSVTLQVVDAAGNTDTDTSIISVESKSGSGSGGVDVDVDSLPGSGTADDPYIISNVTHLQAMEQDLDAHYKLGNDINAEVTANWDKNQGFDPIGHKNYYEETPSRFKGEFDGNNKIIIGLTVNRMDSDLDIYQKKFLGLFGVVDQGARIHNVTLTDVSIHGDNNVGGVVGENFGQIADVNVNGKVSGEISVGGVVGSNRKSVIRAKSTTAVDGSQEVGGIAGHQDEGSIKSSRVNPELSYDRNRNVGLTVGGIFKGVVDNATVTNSFKPSESSITKIVGHKSNPDLIKIKNSPPLAVIKSVNKTNSGETVSIKTTESYDPDTDGGKIVNRELSVVDGPGSIENGQYQAPMGTRNESVKIKLTVTDNDGRTDTDTVTISIQNQNKPPVADAGGLYTTPTDKNLNLDHNKSHDPDGEITDISWMVTSGPGEVVDGTYIPAESVSQNRTVVVKLTVRDNSVEKATDTAKIVVRIEEAVPNNPKYVEVYPDDLPGDGTKNDPYQISNASELQSMRFNLSAQYQLDSDINATLTSDWNNGSGFVPVGQKRFNDFLGTFDGQGHAIKNLTINQDNSDKTGLFGYSSGKISDVSIQNVRVNGNQFVGGIVGQNEGIVKSSSVSGVVVGHREVGGVVGDNEGKLINLEVSGRINGTQKIGGVVGTNDGGKIDSSSSSAKIGGRYDTGGIVGLNSGTVVNTQSAGRIDGNDAVGGIVGRSKNGAVRSSHTSADINGSTDVGGVVGSSSQSNIRFSHSTGGVSGFTRVGGIVGSIFSKSSVSRSYATGKISGQKNIGGIAGRNRGVVNTSFSTGDISGTNWIGGIVGDNYGRVRSTFATGSVIGDSSFGGIVGEKSDSLLTIDTKVINSYWNKDAVNTEEANKYGTGLRSNAMIGSKARSTMKGLEFGSVWETISDGYPELQTGTHESETMVDISDINFHSGSFGIDEAYILSFKINDVSVDNQNDTVHIDLPPGINIDSLLSVDTSGVPSEASVSNGGNTITINLNPAGSRDTTDVRVSIYMEISSGSK